MIEGAEGAASSQGQGEMSGEAYKFTVNCAKQKFRQSLEMKEAEPEEELKASKIVCLRRSHDPGGRKSPYASGAINC